MEPFSILLGAVSIITTIVTTFGGHVENIANRSRDYIECRERLQEYKGQLEELASQVRKWDRVWFWQVYYTTQDYQATYEFLWGEAGYDRIVDIARTISLGFKAIVAMFHFRHESNAGFDWDGQDLPEELRGKPGPQLKKWNDFLDRTYTPQKPHFYEKFAFAIYRNAAFKGRLTNLKAAVENLTSTSARYFYERHDIENPNPPTREAVQRMRDIYFERNRFLSFFQRMHRLHKEQQNNGNGYFWQPVFAQRPFAQILMDVETADCQLHEESIESAVNALIGRANLTCTMYAENWDWSRADPLVNANTIEITYPIDVPGGDDDVLSAGMVAWNQRTNETVNIPSRSTFTGDNITWPQLRDMLKRGPDFRTPTDFQDVFRRFLHHYRLILFAARVSRTVILFYGTEWVRNLCSCRLMRARPNMYPIRELLTRYPTENDFDEGQEPSRTCKHIPKYGRYLTFVLLAVFLAEMAIVAPIEIEYLQEVETQDGCNVDVRFWLPPDVQLPAGFANPLSASELVDNLEQLKPRARTLHVSKKYKKAVKQCLATRQLFLQRNDGVLTAGDMNRCIEDIVKPLEDHCAKLEKEYKKLAMQEFFMNAILAEGL